MSRLLKNCDNQITQSYKKGIHNGIDIVGYKSKTCWILAHSDGVVVDLKSDCNKNYSNGNSYGNYIKIRHNGFFTLYAHLKYGTIKVKKGEFIKKGKEIGFMGNTGHSFGSHLHFEIRDNNDKRIDPTLYLEKDLTNEKWTTGKYKLLFSKAIRKNHTLENNIVKVKQCMNSVKLNLTSNNLNADAYFKVGSIVNINKIFYDKENRIWGKLINTWIVLCNKDGSKQVEKIK